jgi:hypothetical protein
MEPSTDEWRVLYQAAVAFRDAAPWRWMLDSDVFGVQDPESGEIGYCCVMGNLGQHFALGVYQGSVGLEGYWNVRLAPPGSQTAEAILAVQTCLMASFEDREVLDRRDLEQIQALGLKFRGRNAWPLLQSYRPGYEPWYLTAPEVRFLTVCLEQALDVAARFRANPDLLPISHPRGRYLVRVPERRGAEWVWKDTVRRPAPARRPAPPAPPLDEERLRRLRALPAAAGVLQMDYFYSGGTIQNERHERPYFGQVVLSVDAKTGLILATNIAPVDEAPATLGRQLLAITEAMAARPARIEVLREDILTVLKPLTTRLGIRLVRARHLPALAAARRGMEGLLAR